MKNKSALFPAFAALSLALASSVQGDSFVAQCSQSTVMTVSISAPTTTGSLTCPQFNGALGTLTSATFYLPMFGAYLPGAYFTIANPSSSTITHYGFELYAVGIVAVEGLFPDGQTEVAAVFPMKDSDSSLVSIPANSALTVNLPQPIPSVVANPFGVSLNSSGFAAITGNGNFVVPISVSSKSLVESQGLSPLTLADYSASFYFSPGAFTSQGAQLSSNIVFGYTPAPEPSAAGLALCGICGVAWASWRRRSNRTA